MYDLVITNGTVYDGISCNPRLKMVLLKILGISSITLRIK